MFTRILSSGLLLATVYMGVKQGWAMLSSQPPLVAELAGLGVRRPGLQVLGAGVLLGGLLVLPPTTFLWGNYLSAACILFLLALQLYYHHLRDAAIEVPFLLLALLLFYLGHPLA